MIAKARQWLEERYAVFLMGKSPYFDRKWYAEQIGKSGGLNGFRPFSSGGRWFEILFSGYFRALVTDYYRGGWKTHNPSEAFDGLRYIRDNPDLFEKGLCPLYHFERAGKYESGRSAQFYTDSGTYRSLRLWRGIKRSMGKLRYGKRIASNQKARILVCFQLFYPKSWAEVKEYLKNLAPYSYDLVVTYQEQSKMQPILEDIRRFHAKARLIPVENVGFDVGGFWTALRQVGLEDYDVVFKAHSKGTGRRPVYMYRRFFKKRDWFLYLLEGILGAGTVHTTIGRLLEGEGGERPCGLAAAGNLLVEDPPHKQRLLKRVMEPYPQIHVPEGYAYVAGTCFAIRAEHLKWFRGEAFEFELSKPGQFSLAHGLERALCLVPAASGDGIAGNRVCALRQWIRKAQSGPYRNEAMEALLHEDRFELDEEFACRTLETLRIRSYEYTTVRLRDIKSLWYDGSVFPLAESAPYRYLCGDTAVYDEYCRYYEEHNLFPVSRKRFDGLIRSMEEKGFDPRKAIVLRQDNTLLDGQHRLCCLLKQYGGDFEVPAVRLRIRKGRK